MIYLWALLYILIGTTTAILVTHILSGLIKLSVFKDNINIAFDRNPWPFKPSQRWLLKLMLTLFWHKVDWWSEVFYYKNGKPEWMKNRNNRPPSSYICDIPNCRICNQDGNTPDRAG